MFFFSLVAIGGTTIVIIDFAELFGCVLGIEDSVIAITFVALGTSMPDLFASRVAAVQDECADASIVNVTGSNSVNVFLGIGLPWTMSAVYWNIVGPTKEWVKKYSQYALIYPEGGFVVQGGDLTFSVIVFLIGAAVALALLAFRREKLGGELGGDFAMKVFSSVLLCLLWIFYIGLSIWKTVTKTQDFRGQASAVFLSLCALENFVLVCGVVLWCSRRRKQTAQSPDIEVGRVAQAHAKELPQPIQLR